QLRRMDEIESYRQKAYAFSRSDQLGHLIKKSLDLAQTIVRDGTESEVDIFAISAIVNQNNQQHQKESKQDDIIRSMLYGMSASMGSMIEAIIERSKE
ncbi:hypothetical protein PENTCL1PPCAC_4009, partial [Pristionchus entomophagus]